MALLTLKQARERAGLSQSALAASSGVSQTYISDLEASDRPNPTIEVVGKLERALGRRLRFPRQRSEAA